MNWRSDKPAIGLNVWGYCLNYGERGHSWCDVVRWDGARWYDTHGYERTVLRWSELTPPPLPLGEVLVTGATGFLGRHVCEALRKRGVEPHELDSRTDLRSPLACQSAFLAKMPRCVVHLAANCGGIGYNETHPAELIRDNAVMGLNVLDACAAAGVERLVMVGTVCSYPADCPPPFVEENLWAGYPERTNAPYGIAKRMLIEAADAYQRQYGLSVVTLIPANLYGPGDHYDEARSHAIPAIIRKITTAREMMQAGNGGQDVTIWGTGKASRDFLYAPDAAEAIVLAAERTCTGVLNLGTGVETPIYAVAHAIQEILGYTGRLIFDPSRPDGQLRRCVHSGAARHELNWVASTGLRDGLRATVEDYLDRYDEFGILRTCKLRTA